MITPDKPKTYGPISASVQIHRMLGDLHWVGLICSHGVKDGPQDWLSTIYADPDDDSSPAYAAHFFSRDRNIKKAAVLGLNGPVEGIPGQVGDLRIITDPNPDLVGAAPVLCRHCRKTPNVSTEDIIDIAAMWTKRVLGPTIDVRHLELLADRWL